MGVAGLRIVGEGEEGISVEDMRAYELNGVWLGIPLLLMMENAGRSVADYVEYRLGGVRGKRIIVLAGKGGNGGDGFVAARHLAARGGMVEVHLAYPPSEVEHPDAKLNLEALLRMDSVRLVKPYSSKWLETGDADAVIDALLGTGVRGPLRGTIREAAKAFTSSPGLHVSIDVPTGVDPDTGSVVEGAVRADATVTMHMVKKGLLKAKLYTGEIIVAEIGLTRDAVVYAGPGDVAARIPRRPREAHKGSAGRLAVVAGSKYYVGAALLASRAAALVGVDLVYMVSPRHIAVSAAEECTTIIPHPIKGEVLSLDDVEGILGLLERVDGLLIGPGVGAEDETLRAVAGIVENAIDRGLPIVIDADGLKAVQTIKSRLYDKVVLTPHRGEARRLSGIEGDPHRQAVKIAGDLGATVLVKAPVDVACNPLGNCRFNKTGVPAMSVGGTGDVLSGLIAGIMTKRNALGYDPDPLNSAITGAFINGRAGELAYNEYGESMTAYDVLLMVPRIVRDPLKG